MTAKTPNHLLFPLPFASCFEGAETAVAFCETFLTTPRPKDRSLGGYLSAHRTTLGFVMRPRTIPQLRITTPPGSDVTRAPNAFRTFSTTSSRRAK
jgi:hypothetical protein